MTCYIGRFAPSPTGPLHLGSLVAALASWLDARAHHGQWLIRIEDIDSQRTRKEFTEEILQQLHALALTSDATVEYQMQNTERYTQALKQLIANKNAYPCCCSRTQILRALIDQGRPHQKYHALVYPGTCRPENGGMKQPSTQPAWRFHLPPKQECNVSWVDRRLGKQHQAVHQSVGDFVLKRTDGLWAYQLAVVVDDITQNITDVVRGEDIADNTPRQILLYQTLQAKIPRYLHVPLVKMPNGEKLSKQHGAPAIQVEHALDELNHAATFLGLPHSAAKYPLQALQSWIPYWARLHP